MVVYMVSDFGIAADVCSIPFIISVINVVLSKVFHHQRNGRGLRSCVFIGGHWFAAILAWCEYDEGKQTANQTRPIQKHRTRRPSGD
jgi:hypothetical protein